MWRSILLAMLLAPVTACTTLSNTARAYLTAPNGLQIDDDQMRRLLHRGQADSALHALANRRSPLSPDDNLLRLLYQGTAARYAGHYREAGRFFDAAYAVSEDRFTKSIHRTATSLVTNDYALPYTAGQSERLMLHYNALLAWSAAGDADGAAVEARRLVALLAQFGEPTPDERPMRATLHAVASAAFDAAGDWADADVARRNANRLGASLDSARADASDSSGVLVVVVERGDVAHKVAVGLTVPIYSGDNANERGAGFAAERLLGDVGALRNGGIWWDDTPSWRFSGTRYAPWQQARASYLVDMSWPVLRRAPYDGVGSVAVHVTAGPSMDAEMTGSVSAAIAADYRRDRGAIMSRTLSRAIAKYLASRAVEAAVAAAASESGDGKKDDGKKKKKSDGWRTAGMMARMLTNVATTAMEHADTRAWTLLPGTVSVVRMRVPAGSHEVLVDAGGSRQISVPDVQVRSGQTRIVSVRLWRDAVEGFRTVVERGAGREAAPER